MEQLLKSASLEKSELTDDELALINRQTLRTFEASELFTFRLAACDNQVDRDSERFTEDSLRGFARLFAGRPVLRDHDWSAKAQTARVYAADVETLGDVQRLVLRCYIPRTDATAQTITLIESGILREASVGVAVRRVLCSVCGADQRQTGCQHIPGMMYNGQMCVMELDGAEDAYEVSLLPVPCQKEAGIIKSKRYGTPEGNPNQNNPAPWQAQALLELEKIRF